MHSKTRNKMSNSIAWHHTACHCDKHVSVFFVTLQPWCHQWSLQLGMNRKPKLVHSERIFIFWRWRALVAGHEPKTKICLVWTDFHASSMALAAWHRQKTKIGSQSVNFHFSSMEGSHGWALTENQNWFGVNRFPIFVDGACSLVSKNQNCFTINGF